jgi:tetraacyldisaccharide 4'-kinase
LGLGLREAGLRSGIRPIRRLRWPVISIGNLSTGGAGKTPLTIALAKALTRRGVYVDVLSRGYGRQSREAAQVYPRGTADEFGDEPIEIARATGAPVYVAAQRYEAGRLAERGAEEHFSGIHLLDDGFQHRQLHRDLNILLLNRSDWQDCLLPAGNLREPLRAARRASCIAIPAEDRELEGEIKAWGWHGEIWRLHRRIEVPNIDGPVVAFCGIARPEQFFQSLQTAGLRLARRVAFPDHHRYTQVDVNWLEDAARHIGATALITTEKDRVRLGKLAEMFPESISLKAARLQIQIEDESSSMDSLLTSIQRR